MVKGSGKKTKKRKGFRPLPHSRWLPQAPEGPFFTRANGAEVPRNNKMDRGNEEDKAQAEATSATEASGTAADCGASSPTSGPCYSAEAGAAHEEDSGAHDELVGSHSSAATEKAEGS